MKLSLLWPTPIWEIQTPELERIADELVVDYKDYKRRGLEMPYDIFDSGIIALQLLKEQIRKLTNEALKTGNFDWRFSSIMRGRFNMTTRGDWDSPHIHVGPQLVAVYYWQVPEGSGDLVLVAPSFAGGLTTTSDGNKGARTHYTITPKKGLLALFPSDLVHFVLPNETEYIRASVAANIELHHVG